MSLRNAALFSVVLFSLLSMFLVIQHEMHVSFHLDSLKDRIRTVVTESTPLKDSRKEEDEKSSTSVREEEEHREPIDSNLNTVKDIDPPKSIDTEIVSEPVQLPVQLPVELPVELPPPDNENDAEKDIINERVKTDSLKKSDGTYFNRKGIEERRGKLICNGTEIDSEVIYWKIVPSDEFFESPITPHHDLHHDRYITFEYDQGGWNNVRMGMEIVIVIAHAMGRTLALPPPQHLYLLGKTHKDQHDKEAHDEMGFEDFFDIDLLKSHKGSHIITMNEFLEREAVTGGLHGIYPPTNKSDLWGSELWSYLSKVADVKPMWYGKFLAMPDRPENFNLTGDHKDPNTVQRLKKFGGERRAVYYDKELQEAHHLHFPAREENRLLQHHYAFTFFADVSMQSFYKRYIRDYMRYKDAIQCAGAELVAAVRADSLKEDPNGGGDYYALHIRRGDFQFKDVKISAPQIIKNLRFPENDSLIIPSGSLVYISTDDPEGVCVNCYVKRKPCNEYPAGEKPEGCPEPSNWDAFREAGWKLRFLDGYLKQGILAHVNPNTYGMAESIVCSRAKIFAGTYYSTFTGYIHRLRGYHGIGEDSYYHSNHELMAMRKEKSIGHGFFREWRAGWTDEEGGLI